MQERVTMIPPGLIPSFNVVLTIMAYISLKDSFTITIVTEIQAPGSWKRKTSAKELWLLTVVTSSLTLWIQGNSIIHSLLYAYLHISNLILGPVLSVWDPGGGFLSQNLLKEAASFVAVLLESWWKRDKREVPARIKGKTDNIIPLNMWKMLGERKELPTMSSLIFHVRHKQKVYVLVPKEGRNLATLIAILALPQTRFEAAG